MQPHVDYMRMGLRRFGNIELPDPLRRIAACLMGMRSDGCAQISPSISMRTSDCPPDSTSTTVSRCAGGIRFSAAGPRRRSEH